MDKSFCEGPQTQLDLVSDGLDRVDEVARFLKLSRSQVYSLMTAGVLTHVKIGRSRRIPHRCVLEFAARHVVTPK